jgi:hypothetical protein
LYNFIYRVFFFVIGEFGLLRTVDIGMISFIALGILPLRGYREVLVIWVWGMG